MVAFMVDGAGFGEHTCVLALGIDIDGVKHSLALEEGSTENATLVAGLITGLRDRGLDTARGTATGGRAQCLGCARPARSSA